MKHPTKTFSSLAVALKELEPFIRNGQHLKTGRPFASLGGMRSREALANWLLCAAVNAGGGRKVTFTSDPVGGDGIICEVGTGETWGTEHVMVPSLCAGQTGDAESLILQAIAQKHSKGGAAYAVGKTLVVFLNAGAGLWFPNRVARQLPQPPRFLAIWVVSIQGVELGEYVYSVTNLDVSEGDAPTVRVRITRDFRAWSVTPIQGG